MAIGKKTLERYKAMIDVWFSNKFNGKLAYLEFYPNAKENTASQNFTKISKIPEVADYVKKKQEKARSKIELSTDGIVGELMRWLQFDITETIGLSPEELKLLPIEFKRLIHKHKTTERDIYDGKGKKIETIKTIELQFVSKVEAMKMLAKHTGVFEKDNAQKATPIYIGVSNDKHKDIVNDLLSE